MVTTTKPAAPAVATAHWFDVDKEGLAQLLRGRGPERTILELIQNSWDQQVTRVDVLLTFDASSGLTYVRVEDDDPDGFADLSHAFTLFAPSVKKGNAEKRGRFNLGEKLVLAICQQATISTTTGTVTFTSVGRETSDVCRESGSVFEATLRLSREECRTARAAIQTLLPPAGIETVVNGDPLAPRTPVASFSAKLETEYARESDGVLRRSARVTTVRVYDPLPGEEPTVYEMGIPVVAYAGRWHVDVGQRVPLSLERNSVTDGFLRKLRVALVEHLFDRLNAEDARAAWVSAVLGDLSAPPLKRILELRYGNRVVISDPTDPEAQKRAVAEGYTVIHGGSLPREAWDTVREADLVQRAGLVTPTMRVQVDADDVKPLPPGEWTAGMRHIAAYSEQLARELLGHGVTVRFYNLAPANWLAAYQRDLAILSFNYGRLGHRWFNEPDQQVVDELLLHEFGHATASDHLSEEFHDALCTLGARMRGVRVFLGLVGPGDATLTETAGGLAGAEADS